MNSFKTQEHIVCSKCMLKITEHYNGWNFHHNEKPLNTIIKTGLCLGEINQSLHAKHLKHARKLINQLVSN